MALSELFARLTGRRSEPERPVLPRVPTSDDLLAALDGVDAMVARSAVPAPVASRVTRVSRTVRDTIPRLSNLGAGSQQAYNVMATATDYLPEAVDGYLRLPRQWADSRPVDRGKTSLMILIDQLDLLAATMEQGLRRRMPCRCRRAGRARPVPGREVRHRLHGWWAVAGSRRDHRAGRDHWARRDHWAN